MRLYYFGPTVDSVRSEILTEEQLSPLAVVAVSTEFGVVRSHFVANAQILHCVPN